MPVTDYAKWDKMQFSDDDEEVKAAPRPREVAADKSSDLAGIRGMTMAGAGVRGGGTVFGGMAKQYVTKSEGAPPEAVDDPPMLSLDSLSTILHLEMDRAPKPRQGILLNRFEEAGAQVLSAKMGWPSDYSREGDGYLSEEEMDMCAIKERTITLKARRTSRVEPATSLVPSTYARDSPGAAEPRGQPRADIHRVQRQMVLGA